jgi:putative membrane protein
MSSSTATPPPPTATVAITTSTSTPSSYEFVKSLEDGTANKNKIMNRNTNGNSSSINSTHPHHHAHGQQSEAASSTHTSAAADHYLHGDPDADIGIVHDNKSLFPTIFSRLKIPKLHHTKTIPTEWQKAPGTARAQSHLANERTYLAWIRTALAIITLGLAVARFGGISDTGSATITTKSLIAGSLLVGVGGLLIIYSGYRYKRINRQLEKGYFIIGSRGVELPLLTVLLLAVVLAAMLLLFVT